jgi:hypothetical protein
MEKRYYVEKYGNPVFMGWANMRLQTDPKRHKFIQHTADADLALNRFGDA